MQNFLVRTISCLCLVTAWYFDVWWLGIPLLLWHCFQFRGYECIVFAFCIDVQFMAGWGIPWYTIFATMIVIGVAVFKPFVRRQTHLTL